MTHPEPPGLYLHVPFCVRKCPYCAFASGTDLSLRSRWLNALGTEASTRLSHDFELDTLYVGGGTPSVLEVSELEQLFAIVAEHGRLRAEAEITFEANPADLTAERCTALRAFGVNRVSLGVQSLDDRVLERLGRRHDAATALQAIERVRRAGFAALSVDLIYGVPGQGRASWLRTLEGVVAHAPEHLSCYMLTVEPHTPLASAVRAGTALAPSDAVLARRFRETSERLAGHGYSHDEVSSFSRGPEHRARHNGKYWRHVPYLGLGPAAHSFSGRERSWNVSSALRYVERLERGESPVEGSEQLGDEQLRLEALALGLRTADGVAQEVVAGQARQVDAFVARGWLVRSAGRLLPTREGMLFADRMAVELG